MNLQIRKDGVTGAEIVRLLSGHLENMKSITPEGSVHALGIDKLRSADITVWSAWRDDVLVGCGALKMLDAETGEVKAMRTADAHRRTGVGAAILDHIIHEALRRNYRQLFLETGAAPPFAPARALYLRNGFMFCGPFAGYADDPNSVFMVRNL